MPRILATRAEALTRIAQVFREEGFEAATLSRLTQATGLKASSLYNYFPGGKEEMARAVLAAIDGKLQTEGLPVLLGPGTPRDRLVRFTAILDSFYDQGKSACVLNLMTIGPGTGPLRPLIQAAMGSLITALAALAEEGGLPADEARRRAERAIVAVEGSLVVARALEDPSVFQRMLQDLPNLLLGPLT